MLAKSSFILNIPQMHKLSNNRANGLILENRYSPDLFRVYDLDTDTTRYIGPLVDKRSIRFVFYLVLRNVYPFPCVQY